MVMAIYGECISSAARAPVTISRLDRDGCEIVVGRSDRARSLGAEPDLALWIGAIGPLPITAQAERARHGSRLTARFTQPLEPAILAHFSA